MAATVSLQGLPLPLGLGRDPHGTTLAIGRFTAPSDSIATDTTGETIRPRLICGPATVGKGMAICAKRDTIVDRIGQSRIFVYGLEMMRLKFCRCFAVLAGVVVTLKDLATPPLVLPGAVIRFGMDLSGRCIATFFATVLRGPSTALRKWIATELTDQGGSLSQLPSAIGACLHAVRRALTEQVAAYLAREYATLLAVFALRRGNPELRATTDTDTGLLEIVGRNRGLTDGVPILMFPTCFVPSTNHFVAAWVRARYSLSWLFHMRLLGSDYTTDCSSWQVQRLADMGLEPRLEHIRLDNG